MKGPCSSGAMTYKLQYAQTDTCGDGTYTDVPTDDSGDFKIINSSYVTDGQATTDVPSGLTNEETTFVAGQVKDTGNTTGGVTLDHEPVHGAGVCDPGHGQRGRGSELLFPAVTTLQGPALGTYSVYGQIDGFCRRREPRESCSRPGDGCFQHTE